MTHQSQDQDSRIRYQSQLINCICVNLKEWIRETYRPTYIRTLQYETLCAIGIRTSSDTIFNAATRFIHPEQRFPVQRAWKIAIEYYLYYGFDGYIFFLSAEPLSIGEASSFSKLQLNKHESLKVLCNIKNYLA